MDRLNLEEAFEHQQPIKDALGKIREEVEKPVGTKANPNEVISYLKERINDMKPKKEPIGQKEITPKEIIESASKLPSDLETVLKEQKEYVESIGKEARDLKQDYDLQNNRINQFKKSGSTLEDFIKCVLGSK